MEVVVCDSAAEVAVVAARRIEALAPRVLGVATGSTPEGTYCELVRSAALARTTQFTLLDDYLGLAPDAEQRYRAVIERQLVRPLGAPPDRLHGPDVDAADPHGAALRYEQVLAHLGGVDLQVLGIGSNGHIAFNEPGSAFDSRTRVVRLSDATRAANARFFASPDDVPHEAITQGIATIAEARSIVLLATGAAKAPAIAALLDGPPSTSLPASALLRHPDLTVIADRAATALATRTDPFTPHLEYR